MFTINKMVDLLEFWAESKAPFINDFYFGNIYDVNSSKKVKYPLMVVDLSPVHSMEYNGGKISNGVNFIIGFFDQENDQINVDGVNGYRSSNVGDVISDTRQLINDLMKEFTINNTWRDLNISTSNGTKSINLKLNDTGDKIYGWAIEIDINGLYKC